MGLVVKPLCLVRYNKGVCMCVHTACAFVWYDYYIPLVFVSTISQQTESTLLATPLPNFASTPATQSHPPVKGALLQPATHPGKPARKETDCMYPSIEY